MEDAIVIAAEIAEGTGSLAREPITTATLRSGGIDRVVRIVGGPRARLAGYVVPVAGARVRADLREVPRPRPEPLPGPSWIPNTPPGTWRELPVDFIVALPPSRDLGQDALAELDVAARTWGRAPCTSFRARALGIQPALSGDDGENGVFFHDTTWPEALVPGALAQTILHDDGAGNIRDADIHVNGAEHRFSTNGAAGTQDIRGVFVHEIGHVLGLGHATDARATMNVSSSGLRWRSLEKDDIDGVCALYPGMGSDGCDADPCPAGFVCVAGACQRPGDEADVCAPCDPSVATPCEAAGDDARCIEIDGGRVCGRACTHDADCGSGFACQPTTEAGDLQCVSRIGCKNGAHRCTTDAECKHPGIRCFEGACAAPVPVADAGVADAAPSVPTGESSDCSCRMTSPRSSRWFALLALGGALLLARRSRPSS